MEPVRAIHPVVRDSSTTGHGEMVLRRLSAPPQYIGSLKCANVSPGYKGDVLGYYFYVRRKQIPFATGYRQIL